MDNDFDYSRPPAILNRTTFFFYERGLRYVPLLLMLCHWYGVFNFHDNPREILVDIRENEPCIIFLYFMTYVFPLLFMVPASYFFHLCWLWRVPFIYMMGVNAIRLYYHSWLITNEMYDADFILIILVIVLYIYGIAVRICASLRKK